MKKNKRIINYSTLLSSIFFLLFTKAASAQAIVHCSDCKLDDFVIIIIRVSQVILGLVGSLSLMAFVYGGVLFLISGGSSERVTKGRQAITGAVIGLAIVFASYAIITFVFVALDINAGPEGWATPNWAQNLK